MAFERTSPANLARIEKVFVALATLMSNLYGRWLDERGVENINDYLIPVNNALAKTDTGIVATKMNKKPFGFDFAIGGANYKVSVNASKYEWKRVS